VAAAPGECWGALNQALHLGRRGLAGGDSLSRLLRRLRGAGPARLTVRKVLAWADAHRARTGHWPSAASGPVRGAPGENWAAINLALHNGYRGLPGGDSLTRLLERRRGRVRWARQG
jgi:hypothetical protein